MYVFVLRSGSRIFYNCGSGFRIPNPDPDPDLGFDDLKLKQNKKKILLPFLDQKLQFYLSEKMLF
jgi:hypothetical protein